MSNASDVHGIVRPSGHYGELWPQHHNLPHGKMGSFSSAGWTSGNEGFPQQTFLGASIRSFNLNAGFGDTPSTLSVELVLRKWRRCVSRRDQGSIYAPSGRNPSVF